MGYYFIFGTLFIFVLVAAIFVYVFMYQRKAIHHKIEMKDAELKKEKEIYLALMKGEEQERIRVAQEIHDGIGVRLSGIKMLYEGLIHNIESAITSSYDKEISIKVQKVLKEVIEDVRRTSHNLQPAFYDGKTLEPALEEFVIQLNKSQLCKFEIISNELPENLNDNLKLNCYRIATELLMNIVKHSKATQATIQLHNEDLKIQLIIEDNGIGFNIKEKKGGIGLTNIRNRVELCEGKFIVDSNSTGTTIIIDFPIKLN